MGSIMTNKFLSLSLAVSVLALSACAGGSSSTTPASNTMQPSLKTSAIDKAMEKALAAAEASGNSQEILATLEQVHRRNPEDPVVATRYARALRDDEQINASVRVLKPFTSGDNPNANAVTEMAMTQLSLGDFEAAETFATQATEIDAKNARAYLALGTAQDAQNRHQDAEISFRQGVKHWQGDPSPILNNLALNLASQGHLEESLALLEKALKIAPHRKELERNRRIISTLLETSGPRPPAPNAKPAATAKVEAKPEPKVAVKPVAKPTKTKDKNADAYVIPAKKAIAVEAKEVKPVVAKKVEENLEEATEGKMNVKVQATSKVGLKLKNIKLKPLSEQ